MEQHDRILGYFLEEASEHLITIEQGLRKLPETVKQPATIRELFRAAHSIKGSAAMLGLLDIQKIGNQFEANFKLLKEQPEIAVDTHLQSLFLESFSFLQAGIDEVRRSSDPYRQDPATPDPIGDPVFEELKSYLQQLVANLTPSPVTTPEREQRIDRDPAIEQVFGEYVTRKLDEIISLCLQIDVPETRSQIQQICQKLGDLGENFEFLEWASLFAACRLAIANPANSLSRLGETIGIAVKQAQVLVLADRQQAIGVTPELEALIAHKRAVPDMDVPSLLISEDPSTWKLATHTSEQIVGFDLEDTTHKLDSLSATRSQSSAEFLSLVSSNGNSSDGELPFEFDASNNFDLLAVADTGLNTDALELNEFMNLLSDDMPTEGTWMQDEDFFDRDLLLKDTTDLTTDKVVESQPLDPAAALAQAIGQVNPSANEREYDEETFYTPDLDGIDDRDIANFWSDAQLAAVQQPQLLELDLLGDDDSQLQPEFAPAADLVDFPAPDFGLDPAISELFPTATTPVDWTELDRAEAISSADPVAQSATASDSEIAAVVAPFAEHPADMDTPIESSDFHLDLPIPTADRDDSSLDAVAASARVESIEPEPEHTPEVPHQNHDICDITAPTSDVLSLEQVNSNQPLELEIADDLIDAATPSQVDTELSNWIDNSIEHPVANLADFDLGILEDSEPGENQSVEDFGGFDFDPASDNGLAASSSLSDDFAGFDLEFLNGSEPIADLSLDLSENTDLGIAIEDLTLDRPSMINDFTDLDVNPLGSGSLDLQLSGMDELTDLDFDYSASDRVTDSDLNAIEINNLAGSNSTFGDTTAIELESTADLNNLHLSVNNDALDEHFDLNAVDNNSTESDFSDLDLNEFSDLNLDELAADESIASDSTNLEFSDLSLNVNSIDELGLDANDANILTDLGLDLDLEMLGTSEPILDISSDSGISDLNLTSLTDPAAKIDLPIATDLDLSNSDLELLDPAIDSAINSDLTDLNIDVLNDDNSFTIDESSSAKFDDLSALDFNNDNSFASTESSAKLDDLSELDFNNDNSFASTESSAKFDDFSELDFNLNELDANILNDTNLAGDELSSAKFDDLAGLDFNLADLDANLSSHELTDLESMLGSPVESLSEQSQSLENAGDLDALLGLAAIGVGGAVVAGSGAAFDDLDALVAPTPAAEPATHLDDLDRLLDTPAPVANPPASKTDKKSTDRRAKQSRTFEQTMRVSVRHLDNLNNLVGELVVNRNTLEQDQNRMRQFVEKLLSEVQKLNEVGKRMQDLYERSLMENSLVASRQQYKPAPTSNTQITSGNIDESGTLMEYDPLEMDRFTPIHLLSQKMIELTVRVRESTADIEFVVDGSTEVTRTLRQITGQLQEDLTKSRMVPFAQTADRLQRGVRDNGLKYGKQIELNVEGRDTPIDKVILESLTEPLIHMVNNAIAHGIESAESRQANGKSLEGKITIRALHQGNQTIISISDDGAGIDTERVKNKAIEKGVITAGQASTMSKAEIYELLFLPSFSTKDQADELSGRGVGMDVVRTSITEIRGTITTESQLGVGTTFTIRLPLALSIAKALIAVNNKSNIAFPMDGIEDTQDVSPEQIQTNSEGEQCIFWRDRLMPFKPLSDLLAFNRPLARNNFYTTNEDDSDLVSILILRSDGNLMAIQVDKITGDREIVIKPLQGPAAKPLGIAGATVLGDGRIIPIADVMELIALANGTLTRHVPTQWTDKIATPAVELRESMVLIVDDSITVRELLSLTFKRAGYRVEQARDGQEAWDKLRAGLPCEIVFCDIEMPRMDGLEFLSRVQKDVALSKVPVAMLTSRGSDRHRQIASQLGASGYFIKPYLEEALLDAAKRMIKGEVLEIV